MGPEGHRKELAMTRRVFCFLSPGNIQGAVSENEHNQILPLWGRQEG